MALKQLFAQPEPEPTQPKPKVKPRPKPAPPSHAKAVPIQDLTRDELIANLREVAVEVDAPIDLTADTATLRAQLQTLEAKRATMPPSAEMSTETLSYPPDSKATIQAWLDRDTYANFDETLNEWQKAADVAEVSKLAPMERTFLSLWQTTFGTQKICARDLLPLAEDAGYLKVESDVSPLRRFQNTLDRLEKAGLCEQTGSDDYQLRLPILSIIP